MKSWWTVPDSHALELRELPLPEPKAGEIRVRVRAASLNRGEFLHSPSHQGANEARPAGSDAAGEVDATGEGVTGWKKGDRVMGPVRGAYAEYAIADPRLCSHAPEALSWEEAAAVPIVFQTTYDMLWTQGHLQRDEWLLVTGISSGVGVASLLAAKAIGARVIGTSGSRAKLDALKKHGLDVAIETRAPDFSAKVLEATGGKGADLVVNNVGGTVFAECVKSMAYKGRLATVGYLDNTFEAKIDLNALHAKRLHLFGVSARYRPINEREETLAAFRRDMLPLFAQGRIRPVIDKVFTLDEMPKARARMESNAQVGKIVLKM
jgi:NADPH:quinone reductase